MRRFNSYNYFQRNDATSSTPPPFVQQRWLAVIDGSTRKVLYNKVLPNLFAGESLSAAEVEMIREAVNQAELPAEVNDFREWAEAGIPDPNRRGERDDADGDGIVNLLEYAYGSNPVVRDAGKAPRIERDNGDPVLVFQQSTTALVAPFTVFSGDSPDTTQVLDISSIALSSPEVDGVIMVRVPLSPASAERQFLRLSTTPLP